MEIMVRYENEVYSIVQSHELDDLIAANKIIAFRRSSGWAELGKDPVRGMGSPQEYTGVDRRGTGPESFITVT